eukprot:scaffold60091_cov28-Tisochrysis_lutea.AAC.5
MRSPDGASPRAMDRATDSRDISPSRQIWMTARTSGSRLASASTGPSSTKSWCAGASESSYGAG